MQCSRNSAAYDDMPDLIRGREPRAAGHVTISSPSARQVIWRPGSCPTEGKSNNVINVMPAEAVRVCAANCDVAGSPWSQPKGGVQHAPGFQRACVVFFACAATMVWYSGPQPSCLAISRPFHELPWGLQAASSAQLGMEACPAEGSPAEQASLVPCPS